ncbi:MAG TPA: chlorophyllase [Trebonia sp.]|nr:chlorophyllase [Trebonia sp.]
MDSDAPLTVLSAKPVVIPAPGRGEDLQVRVSAPAAGRDLPVIVFSHGFGGSMDDYQPLVDYWTRRGFAVLQPTHLDSITLGLAPEDPRTPDIWRFRVDDLRRVIDHLDVLQAAIPGLAGRLARDGVVIAGHSWGATTASALLGARVVGSDGQPGEDMSDPRVRAGVLLALAGHGGEDLTPFAAEHFPFMSPDFTRMTRPALLVAGDQDQSLLSTRGPDWWADGYVQSPGAKSLLTLFGAEHSLGGITGYTVTATTDESPERVALLARVTTAYLRDVLGRDDADWTAERKALAGADAPLGRLDVK